MLWLCTFFPFFITNCLKIRFKDVQLPWQQKYGFDNESYSSKIVLIMEKWLVEDDKIGIVGTMPEISRNCSAMSRQI